MEIAAFNLGLPEKVLTDFYTSVPKMTATEKNQPWTYQEKLEEFYTGQDNVMPQRLTFFN